MKIIEMQIQAMTLEQIAKGAGDLPAFPAVAMQALQVSEDPKTSARQLQFIIAKDQALTARILRIVNSAMYSFQREVSTLSHAIAILGFDTVRSIIVAATVRQVFPSGRKSGPGLTNQLLWQHSWGAAVAARAIAVSVGHHNADEAFTGGLLHDIGKMVLLKNREAFYAEILNAVHCGETSFYKAENERFGFSHADVGALLASKWNFPSQLVDAILHHHDAVPPSAGGPLPAIVALSNRMMALMEIGFEKDRDLTLEEEPSARLLELEGPALQKLAAEVELVISKTPGIEKW
jgi:putative nucleotidyltransferase with HDIG domain